MKYVNVTVRVSKIKAKDLEKEFNNGDLEYITMCKNERRYRESIFRYIGNDKPEEGLYHNDLVIAE